MSGLEARRRVQQVLKIHSGEVKTEPLSPPLQ
jgi:hypothetical protein